MMTTAEKYIYVDADNAPLFTKERYVKKDGSKGYAYSHVTSNGENVKTMPAYVTGTKLYNLHRLAKYPLEKVYLVEGEKCVDALTKLRLLATTSGGATSAKDADWQPLNNREVIIWADNDTAGLQYRVDALAQLTSVNATVTQIDIDQLNLPVKGDCVDWLQQFDQLNGHSATVDDIQSLQLKTNAQNQAVSDCLTGGDANVLPQSDDDVVAWLATLKPLDYDRVRKVQAKALNVQVKTLDNMVNAEREANIQDDSPFADIEPWHEAIDPSQLLDDITSTIQRFIVLDKHQAQTVALWVSACWFVDVISFAPFVLINAPERACGKTQLLTLMSKFAPRSLQASGISPAALYRTIEKYQPTLFIDEIETVLKDNEPLRGIFNAGYSRDSSIIVRCVGDDLEPTPFNIWGMKAIAGINAIKLSDTITSRSIVIELRRKTANEKVERIRHAEAGLFDSLASKLARFSDDYTEQVRQSRPNLPDALGDREQDNWEPLLQVASVAGGHWLDTALKVALQLSEATVTPISSANELLADIQEVFETKGVNRITTTELITTLCDDPEKSWATYNRGKQLSPWQLSRKLKDYGIASKDLRFAYDGVKKGYEAEQFNDAFKRYLSLPPENELILATALQANDSVALNVAEVKLLPATRNNTATLEPSNSKACSGVAEITPILGGSTQARNAYEAMRF